MFESVMTPKMAETAPDCHQGARQNNASPRRQMLRGLGAMAMAGLLAACQVVPKTGGPATPPPPTDPTDNVGTGLPTDTDRLRLHLLVPKTGPNRDATTHHAQETTHAQPHKPGSAT